MMRGHIQPTWDLEDIKQLKLVGKSYSLSNSNALSDLFDPEDAQRYNTSVWQIKDLEGDIKFFSIYKEFNWLKQIKVQVNRLDPGNVLPKHKDVYKFYNELTGINDNSKISRVMVMLDDWQSGQYIEIANFGFTNWTAGDWISFKLSDLHMTANLGHSSRYIMIITGITNQ